ncbi:hypothetical protein Dimus_033766 [Dionaea muscipula]
MSSHFGLNMDGKMAQPYLPRWYIQQKKSLPSSFCIFNFFPCLLLWRAVEISAAAPTAQRSTNSPSISNSDFQSTPPLGVPLSSTSSKILQRILKIQNSPSRAL